MCLFSIDEIPPRILLDYYSSDKGIVITSRDYLEASSEFLKSKPELLLNDLIGRSRDWEMLCEINEIRPEMAIELRSICFEIQRTSIFFRKVFGSLICSIVPLKDQRARGLSSDLIRGEIFIGYPQGYSRTLLAMDIVHEMGHQALSLVLSCDDIFISDPRIPVFSEIRHTDRPAIQSLHAAAAIAYMTLYVKQIGAPSQRHPDCPDDLSETLHRAVNALTKTCKFTPVGDQVLRDFDEIAAM
jgi:hypothetical protein